MTIDHTGPTPLRPVQPASRIVRPAERQTASEAAEHHDRIDLSAEARRLVAAESVEQREARLAALRAAVEDGTYRVDAHDLASRLAERGEA